MFGPSAAVKPGEEEDHLGKTSESKEPLALQGLLIHTHVFKEGGGGTLRDTFIQFTFILSFRA